MEAVRKSLRKGRCLHMVEMLCHFNGARHKQLRAMSAHSLRTFFTHSGNSGVGVLVLITNAKCPATLAAAYVSLADSH